MVDHAGRRLVALIIAQSFMLIMHYYYYYYYYSRDETAVQNYKLADFLNSTHYTILRDNYYIFILYKYYIGTLDIILYQSIL